MMLIAWLLLADRPTLLPVLGALLGFVGVGVMVLGDTVRIDPLGVAASLAAMLMSSFGFILTKKWAVGQKTIAITSWQLIAGGLLILPFALAFEGGMPTVDAPAVLAFAYAAVVATALGYVAWFAGLRHLPAGTVGLVGLLNPVTGVLLGTLVASEPFGPRQAVGTMLVLIGVLLGRKRQGELRVVPRSVGSARHQNS